MLIYKCDMKGCNYTAGSRDFFKHVSILNDDGSSYDGSIAEMDLCPTCANKLILHIKGDSVYASKGKASKVKPAGEKESEESGKPEVVKSRKSKSTLPVAEILTDYLSNNMSQKEIAKKYERSQSVISRLIAKNKDTYSPPISEVTTEEEANKIPVVEESVTSVVNTVHTAVPKVSSTKVQKTNVTHSRVELATVAVFVHKWSSGSYDVKGLADTYKVTPGDIENPSTAITSCLVKLQKNIVKLYESGCPVDRVAKKYAVPVEAAKKFLLQSANKSFIRKDVNPNAPVFTETEKKYDLPGVIALYNAGWLITDICDEKNYTLDMVIKMLNTLY